MTTETTYHLRQFSLRFLFAMITLCAALIGVACVHIHKARIQSHSIQTLRDAGCLVAFRHPGLTGRIVEAAFSAAVSKDGSASVWGIYCDGKQYGKCCFDAECAQAANRLRRLEVIHISNTEIDESTLRLLLHFPGRRKVYLTSVRGIRYDSAMIRAAIHDKKLYLDAP